MPLLDCSATKCKYNDSYLCSLNKIEVSGEQACHGDCTCCGSFDERTKDNFSNSTQTPDRATNVMCEAVKCIYNDDKLCSANQIGIIGSDAREAENTECATFKPR